MSSPRVSIIIVNWNGIGYLEECLGSIQQQSYRDFEVVMVDNGSTDGSIEYVTASFPWVRIVPLPENRGFAAGNNAGLEVASGSLVVTLNNDTKSDPAWLSELVRVADSDERAGMVASCILRYDNPDLVDSLGVGICSDGMSRGSSRLRRLDSLACRDGAEILLPSACAALYRRAMIDEIGFFDADFFAYCEDTDLGLRGRLAGWKALLAKNAIIYHKYSMTGGAFSPLKLYLVERNHYWMALKCLPPSRLLMLPFRSLQRYLLQAFLVSSGRGVGGDFASSPSKIACMRALAGGIFAVFGGLPRIIAKRRAVIATKRISWAEYTEILDHFSISYNELLDVN